MDYLCPMLILMDCRPLQYAGQDSEKRGLIFSIVHVLAREKAVRWLFMVDHTFRPELFPGLPPASVVIRRALPGRVGWKLWYDWQLPRLAKKQGADAVMLTGGIAAALTSIPQLVWLPERADPAGGQTGRSRASGWWPRVSASRASGWHPSVYPGRLAASLLRAAVVFCFSERDRAWLAGLYPGTEERVFVVTAAAAEGISPLSPEEKGRIKAANTQGKEYFLADLSGAGEKEVMHMLKAFSQFKKRQHSNMQLVITGRITGRVGLIKDRLKAYRYRQDVCWKEGGEVAVARTAATAATGMTEVAPGDGCGLMGAAYAVLYLFDGCSLGVPLMNAWRADVPVIVVNGGLLQETAGEAALGFVAGDPASLAAQLMLLYKDENFRRELISKGWDRLGDFGSGRAIDTVWEGISRATGEPVAE
jgi:glycosyltransferase involved in cell wall biosynthesis